MGIPELAEGSVIKKKKKKHFLFHVEYNQLAMLWWFQVYSRTTGPYIYMYPFSPHSLPSSATLHWAVFLCYTVLSAGSCWLFILNTAVCRCQSQTLTNSSPPQLWVCESFYVLIFFFLFVYKGCHTVFLPFCLISLSMTISKSIHVAANALFHSF